MKLLVRLLLVLAALLVMALVGLTLGVDGLVRTAVEKGGTYALGVPTTLAEADIGLFSGTTRLAGFEIANPPGFEQRPFARLGSGELAVSLPSLRGEVIEVPRLALADVSILLQRREGRTNYGVILDNLERLQSGEPGEPGREPPSREGEPEPDAPGKRFVIREIEITGVTADIDLLPAGGELTRATVTLPRLVLTDVGTAEGGASVAEITGEVVKALLQATLEAGAGVLGPEALADLKARLRELGVSAVELGAGYRADLERIAPGLGEKADKALEELDRSLEGLFKKK